MRTGTAVGYTGIASSTGIAVAHDTHPVTPDRFEDFADVVNPNRRTTHCWCLSHRLSPAEIEALGGPSREQAMREVCERHPPGVVTYREGVPVGWCSISPRTQIPKLVRSRVIRPVDDVEPWCIICVVVRGGHRRRGVTRQLLEGAVQWAASQGATAVESYPVDTGGQRIDTTMAFVGTRAMFEAVGFEMIGTTDATGSGLPRVVMRRMLSEASPTPDEGAG